MIFLMAFLTSFLTLELNWCWRCFCSLVKVVTSPLTKLRYTTGCNRAKVDWLWVGYANYSEGTLAIAAAVAKVGQGAMKGLP